jgi:hypothetical protein
MTFLDQRLRVLENAFTAITLNEIGTDTSLVYKFSDPDGVRTGRSGWSFGRSQFDFKYNYLGRKCLEACGFSGSEIADLIEQRKEINMDAMNSRLKQSAAIVDRFDKQHLEENFEHCALLLKDRVVFENEAVFVHIMDYHNQMYFSQNGKLHSWLLKQTRPISESDIFDFKLNNTRWGRQRPDDVKRRFKTISDLCKGL